MKKSVYLLMMFFGFALTSCEPMEDIHNEVDQRLENAPIVGISEYTFVEEDYKAVGVTDQFNSLEDAAELIPDLLASKFPVWGEGSLAQVTFDLNAPNTPVAYTLTESGYEAVGLERDYFTTTSEIKEFLEFQFPQASLNDYVKLTFRTVAVEKSYELNDDDFELIEDELAVVYPDPASSAGRFGNFDRREGRDPYWSNEMILEALNVVLEENFRGIEGQTYEVSYPVYNGSPGMESMKLRYNGTSYVPFGATAYEISNDDYDFIGAEFAEEYPGPAGNAAQYNSFDIRESSANYWSDEMILEAINALLMEQFPSASEGAQFNVSLTTFAGSAGTSDEVVPVVLKDGVYVINEEETVSTVMQTQVFAFGDNMWHVPLNLPANVYKEEFGQAFNNFSNEADAGFYIGRWLEPRFPYAMDGDFVSVAYNFTYVIKKGDEEVRIFETRYASFVYSDEEREWVFIPTVIPYTLQFGHEGTGWVVDNTIVYQLTPADYVFIGQYFAEMEKFVDPAWSVGRYQNFDRRQGTRNFWSTEMIIKAMNILLQEKVAPNAEEGQKYLLVFDIYDGTNTTEQLHLIKDSKGVWVPVD